MPSAWFAKRHVHHERRVTLGGREVDEAAVGERGRCRRPSAIVNSSTNSRAIRVSVASGRSAGISISTLKWPVFAEDRAVLHQLRSAPRRSRSCRRWRCRRCRRSSRPAPSSSPRSRPSTASSAFIGSTSVTITCAPMPACARRDAATDPAVAADDELLAGEQHVRRADDPVDRRLARAVAVVEHVLRHRLVDGDDREAELALGLERLQADDAGRRLLGAGDDVAELLAARASGARRSRRRRRPS